MFKNGKLFKKLNIIDALAILVILAAAAAVVFFVTKPKVTNDTLVMKFRIEEVDSFVAEKVHVGDELYDDTYVQELGKVTAVELNDSISYGQVEDGMYTLTSKEGYYSMIITGEVEGKKTNLGAEINDKKYGVGHSMVLRAGDAKLYLRVYDIAVKGEENENGSDANEAKTVPVTLSFYAPEVPDYVVDALKEQTAVSDAVRKTMFGTVEKIEINEAQTYVETENGLIQSAKPGFNAVKVTVSAEGEITENGLTLDGRVYSIGDEIELRVGLARITADLCAIGE